MNDAYKLLYNNLWLVNKGRISKLNPTYIVPEDIKKATTSNSVKIKTPSHIQALKPVLIDKPKDLAIPNTSELILNWDKLISTISDCRLCPLCENRKNVVIERGNRQASWMFVGEAPGRDEDEQGRPFVGNSGQLLNKMIQAMKLDKELDVYICNVVKCRPPSNRNPEENEIAMCKNYLLSQIELVKPQIIVALGRFASQMLLNSTLAIEKLRGKVHKFNDIPLIVSYHPAYLLRNVDAKKKAWEDLQLALKIKG